ncbi:hypothetical protein [Plantactinospora sp. B5E13]|uniref:hypothetical protein n=1 Tax=unclassified Plantactinospora TaxID=2631981 RepID=UPI00325E017D
MNNWRTLPAIAAGSLLLLVTACAQGADGTGAGAPGLPVADAADPSGVVLRVEHTGGYVTPAILLGRLPMVTVYADGRVITEGPQTLAFPGPALPNVQVQRIAGEDVDRLIERARAAGVEAGTDLGRPSITDVPSTRFTVRFATGTEVLEVYALDTGFQQPDGSAEGGAPSDGLTEAQRAGRAKLRELVAALTDLAGTLGADRVGPAEPYQPSAVAALATAWPGDPEGLPAQPALAWPGPALPGPSLGPGPDPGCVELRGAALSELLTMATKANAQTPWTSGDDRWTVALRPLLPDETECADLATD